MECCPICNKHAENESENKVFEGENIYVYHGPFESQLVGYLYIEPKRHVENWHELTEQEMLEIGSITKKVSNLLKDELNAERVYSVVISEAVRHLHIHIIPRKNTETVKGLTLIAQATQQKLYTKCRITKTDIENFIKLAKTHL